MAAKKAKTTKITETISENEKHKEAFVKIQNKIQANKDRFTLSEKIKYLTYILAQADNNPFEITEFDIEMMLKNQPMVKKLLKSTKALPHETASPSSKSKMLKEISEKVDAKIYDLSTSSSKIIETIEEKVQEAIKKLNK